MKWIKYLSMMVMSLTLCACTTSKSLSLVTSFDDKVTITLDTTDGHDMKYRDDLLSILFDKQVQMEGVLVSGEGVEEFLNSLRERYSFEQAKGLFVYEWCEEQGETMILCPLQYGRLALVFSSSLEHGQLLPILERLSFSLYD